MSSLQTTAQHTGMCGIAIIPIVVFVSLLGTQQAFAQCRVAGDLRTADGAPIAGAMVRVESPDLRAPVTGITDASGHYDIDHVKPGIYVKVTAFHQNGRLLARTFSLVTDYVEIVNLRTQPESAVAMP